MLPTGSTYSGNHTQRGLLQGSELRKNIFLGKGTVLKAVLCFSLAGWEEGGRGISPGRKNSMHSTPEEERSDLGGKDKRKSWGSHRCWVIQAPQAPLPRLLCQHCPALVQGKNWGSTLGAWSPSSVTPSTSGAGTSGPGVSTFTPPLLDKAHAFVRPGLSSQLRQDLGSIDVNERG